MESNIQNTKKEIDDTIKETTENQKGKEGDLKKEMIQKNDSKQTLSLKSLKTHFIDIKKIKEIKRIQKIISFSKLISILLLIIIIFLLRNKVSKYNKGKKYGKNYYENKYIITDNDELFYFELNDYKYDFSFDYNISKIQYNVILLDHNKKEIKPSDFNFRYNNHFFCYFKNESENNIIYSYPSIILNKYFSCIEYININDKGEFGFIFYRTNYENYPIYLFTEEIINYDNLKSKNDIHFNPQYALHNYYALKEEISQYNYVDNANYDKPILLKSSFIMEPICDLKSIIYKNNNWNFMNLFNDYFCFCQGWSCLKNDQQKCKYYIYLTIIDSNRDLYKKTDHLLADFFIKSRCADHAFPVFKEMLRQNMMAHYMTEKPEIIQEYCGDENPCLKIVKVIDGNKIVNGDFLEKNLELILRLKTVITASTFFARTNIFYDIEYLIYINLNHGVQFFKHFLYNRYLHYQRYNKILIPPSEIIFNVTKRYGWKDENIIKIGLPKWDSYYEVKNTNNDKSVFFMFTWREMNPGKEISDDYLNNIINFIKNKRFLLELVEHNIFFFVSLHSMVPWKKVNLRDKSHRLKYKFITEDEISDTLSRASLVITDFSSVLFENIARKKPYIMYIPDANDPNLKDIYIQGYYDVINGFKNGSTYFENIFYDIEKAVDKVIYYIKNDFMLDDQLIQFYKVLNLSGGNNTMAFVEYVKNLK